MHSIQTRRWHNKGFTLIELLVVLAIVALLTSLALPRYLQNIDTSKEVILIENLRLVRISIDQFYGDTGRYPDSLEELVERHYLRNLPMDPITERSDSWQIEAPDTDVKGAVFNIKSTASGQTRDGRAFTEL